MTRPKPAAELLAELATLGFDVASAAELPRLRVRYDSAIPVLMKWLPLIPDPDVKEEIVRALSVPFAKCAAPLLIEQFRRAPSGNNSLKWAIGNGLEVIASDAAFDGVVAIVQDKNHGKSREMAVAALGNMKDSRAVEVLVGLLDDDEVAGHAIWGLRKLKATTSRAAIEPFVQHPKSWIRREAKKAIAAIEKAGGERRR